MIGSTRPLRVWAYAAPADLRKGFDGLAGLVSAQLQQDPLGGACFLFVNRPRTQAKVLLWDGTGRCVYKRLEQGRFAALWAAAAGARRSAPTDDPSEPLASVPGTRNAPHRDRAIHRHPVEEVDRGDVNALGRSTHPLPALEMIEERPDFGFTERRRRSRSRDRCSVGRDCGAGITSSPLPRGGFV